ncbi:hypothetical protein VOLCADRAFT_93852 [Volvox carteri f. nagariensis]|uniref:C-type lectin domain-containing protein n=1 Tax=Volvox carteri f. nagariensis TaxID=3068 RepID=D8U384_VOLCA|nr:uncharacterized protein VOLCADRAFT_93852 [Volvox carteri f. nagariensis]EFJ45708.1 hypothetical protein VOLCADRAFT_93852 [Volvox carteri f. nagariensis]|eukprot:XP_002953109.1 hypothetical protein VOLCADRAFT_93852 [Volvox carteri f. nagariensis]
MLRMRMLALLLAVALPSSMAACSDPFTYTYNKIKYDNAEESGRSYTLYDIYPGGCLWNFTTAKAICEQDGLQLAPHGEAQSLAVLRELCAKNRYTCWMDGVPADPSADLCYLMSQEGDVHLQGCDQPVRFVCRDQPCSNPFTYRYNKIKYNNTKESGRIYTLYDIYTGGCLWNFTTAKAICKQDGLELAPHGEAQSLAVLRELCAKNRYTCWMDGVPADPSSDLCYLMSQEGDVHLQGCDQPVRFVCRQRAAAGRAAARGVAVPSEGVLSLSSHGYDYRLYTVDAAVRMSYHGAVEFCQELGAGWDLVPYWDDSSNAYAAVLQLCADLQFTCWLKRKDDSRTGSSGPMLCPLMAADGGLQMQGCEQDVRFVCRKAQRAT